MRPAVTGFMMLSALTGALIFGLVGASWGFAVGWSVGVRLVHRRHRRA